MKTRRSIHRNLWVALAVAGIVAGCGSDDDGSPAAVAPPPIALQQNQATCEALSVAAIASSAIAEPKTGATVASATYVFAVPDRPDATGTAIVQGAPDYCRLTLDVGPVDTAAPVVKLQVNLPIARGYLTLGTGSGHQAAANVEAQAFALNDGALTNFVYASYKKAHDVAKQLALFYDGKAPTKSDYMGARRAVAKGSWSPSAIRTTTTPSSRRTR